jgi:ribosome biogenesis GTPase / thiamine phosphate phosphatase
VGFRRRLGYRPARVDDSLQALGWDDEVDAERASMDHDPGGRPVRVARIDRKWCTIWREPEDPDPLRIPAPEDLAAGDWVLLADPPEKIAARIPRHSALARRSSDGSAQAQVIAANLDRIFVVHAAAIEPNRRRLERELVIAYESGAEPVVVLTKVDLLTGAAADAHDLVVAAVEDVAPGVPVHLVSGVTGEGLDSLATYTAGHRTIALVGPSGAGKSTLVNALVGGERMRTGEIREADGRGRHTTSAAELVALPGGGLLVDTPGLRAVALWSEGAGFDEAFADITELADGCRFRDCRHEAEPGCAVRAAVESGALHPARLRSWKHLKAELDALRSEQAEWERTARRGRRPPRRGGRPVDEDGDDTDDE